jgi:Gram-negative bacterial TonB protein C-terminal
VHVTPGTGSRRRRVTIVVAVAALLLAFAYVRPSRFGGHRHDPEAPPADSSRAAAWNPDAVIAIQVDVENRLQPIDVTPIPDPPPPPPPAAADTTVADAPGGDDDGLDSLDLAGASAPTRASANVTRIIPPRPVEITWPETSRLKQCIGRHVDVDIRVGADGTVLRVEPVDRDFPEDCLRSALNAAAQIRFLPGTVDGKPATLSTRVRIDFEKRK